LSHTIKRKHPLTTQAAQQYYYHAIQSRMAQNQGRLNMLTLTRKTNESILIHTLDGIIEVSVNQVRGGQVKLGITAPAEVLIMRKEIDDSTEYEG